MENLLQQLPNPAEEDVLVRNDFINYTHQIGILTKFDSTDQTGAVKLFYKNTDATYYGSATEENYTVFYKVPLRGNYNQNCGMVNPPAVGDSVLLHINKDNLEGWWNDNQPTPATYDISSPNDCFGDVGYNNINQILQSYNTQALTLFYQQTQIVLNAKVKIANEQQSFWQNVNNLLSQLNSLASQLGTLASTLASATTSPAVIGAPSTMSPTTIANAQAAATQANTIATQINTLQNNLSELLTD